MSAVGPATCLFWIAWDIIGHKILLNLFLAILINNFQDQEVGFDLLCHAEPCCACYAAYSSWPVVFSCALLCSVVQYSAMLSCTKLCCAVHAELYKAVTSHA